MGKGPGDLVCGFGFWDGDGWGGGEGSGLDLGFRIEMERVGRRGGYYGGSCGKGEDGLD